MVNKYLISLVKRIFKIKAKVITKELETFIGEKTSKYLIPYLEEKAKHLNFLDEKKRLRQLNKEQLKTVVGELKAFMESENAEEFKKVFGIDISVDDIKREVQEELDEIKAHLNNLKDKVENMYDNTMEKISEVYETKLRYRALYFGIALAFIINADLFGIYNSLSKNPGIRDKLVVQSDDIRLKMEKISNQIAQAKDNGFKNKKELEDEIDKVYDVLENIESSGIVLGWTKQKFKELGILSGIYKIIGLLISGLLISFGAPFWHDFIGTFTGLRKTLIGKKEENKKNDSNGNGGVTTPSNTDRKEG
jgi:hypothetical protein